MAKFEFQKDKKKVPQPINETKISAPKEKYDPTKINQQVQEDIDRQVENQLKKKRPVGRPKSGRKSYQTVRLQKETVIKINALENALSIKTQDETVNQAIDKVLRSLNTNEMRSYKLWLEMFEKKENI